MGRRVNRLKVAEAALFGAVSRLRYLPVDDPRRSEAETALIEARTDVKDRGGNPTTVEAKANRWLDQRDTSP